MGDGVVMRAVVSVTAEAEPQAARMSANAARRTRLRLAAYPGLVEHLVVTRALPGGIPVALARRKPWVWDSNVPIERDALLAAVAGCTGLLTMLSETVDAELLAAAPKLRVISQMAVGVDNIDVPLCVERGIVIGHTPDVLTETTADTAFALLAASARRLPEGIDQVRAGEWKAWRLDNLVGGDIHGATLGIVGLGRIGRAVAHRAAGFGMKMLYTGRERKPHYEASLGIAFRSLPDLLVQSDFVVLTASLNDSTRHLIDEAALRSMRSDAILVNVARGGLIDQEALLCALSEGWIAGAALDVTDPEPISPDHPLVALPNCLIVPHIGSASVRTRLAMAALAVDNLLAGVDGRSLPAPFGQSSPPG